MATRARVPRKDVDAWFVDARKRIGWTALRKKRFSNRRADIVEAAAIAFGTTKHRSKHLDDMVEGEFVALRRKAEELFASKLKESELATKLDGALDEMISRVEVPLKVVEPMSHSKSATAYPTPERSPSSLSRTLSSSSLHDTSTTTPSLTCKRMYTAVDDSGHDTDYVVKRRR